MTARWSLVVPVKRLAGAKTRLAGLAGGRRAELALAFAADTVAAALDCPEVAAVAVVTSDPDAAALLGGELGALIVPDQPEAGLNPALRHGAAVAADRWPGHAIGALSADLPALRPAELAVALALAAGYPRAYLADAAGTGTTVLTALAGVELAAAFGTGSSRAHAASGAVPLADQLAADVASVRRDVDTPAELAQALLLGVGKHTAGVLASLARMQATVRTFDPTTRSGSVLLDDGTELPYDGAAFDAGGLRLLRFGQRVRILVEGEGADTRVTFLTLATL
ncbi:MAG: 2-phospho-L-lactate guanylyltransferase [Sporichthyaceae bacterium]|nr:2-phospho-L-lactate guanylyltransferase [Sporichthyaceae bacterium]